MIGDIYKLKSLSVDRESITRIIKLFKQDI